MSIEAPFLHRSDVPRRPRARWYLALVNATTAVLSFVPTTCVLTSRLKRSWWAVDCFGGFLFALGTRGGRLGMFIASTALGSVSTQRRSG